MKGQRAIERYVEAELELRSYRQQIIDYPELKQSVKHKAELAAALVERDAAYRNLRGGWLAAAQRRIREIEADRCAPPDTDDSTT